MNTKVKKGLLWALAVIFMLIVIQWLIGNIGGDGMYTMHHPPQMHAGHGQPPFMRGHHGGGFHFFGAAVSLVFWLAVAAVLVLWLRKRYTARSVNHSQASMSMFDYTHTSHENQVDFLDEWEKKQRPTKEDN